MSSAVDQKAVATPVAIPIKDVVPWAAFAALVMILAYYFVGAEGGAFGSLGGMTVHEWVHDARHLLGFPCH